jgi:uncharacterized membrane-anchored protein
MKTCPSCGSKNLNSAVVCEDCGVSIKKIALGPGSSMNQGQVEQLESNMENVDQKYVGIGGWLILPAIGFVLGPIIGVIGLIASLGMYSDVARAGYGGIYTIEIIVIIGLLCFLLYAATLFFKKKSNAPSTIITLLIVSLVSSCVLLVIELSAGAEPFAIETGKQLVREIIGAAIWIPFFRVSKRVKATFVN